MSEQQAEAGGSGQPESPQERDDPERPDDAMQLPGAVPPGAGFIAGAAGRLAVAGPFAEPDETVPGDEDERRAIEVEGRVADPSGRAEDDEVPPLT
jgi:hypothetical protein